MAADVRERFGALLDDPAGALVACDYDGTLAPIVDDPARAVPAPGALEALGALAGLVGRVAVVSGRPALDAVRVGGLDAVPGLVVAGLYGAQRWSAGELRAEPVPGGLAAARAEVARLLASGAYAGVRVEDKGGSFAVHTRRAPDPEGALGSLREPLAAVAERHGLRLEPGRLVLELRGEGADKGAALTALALETPACRSVLYAGDDLGDLAAFDAVAALRARGVAGWTVAAASPEAPEVSAAADVVVDGPAGVVGLLRELASLLDA